MPYLWHMVALRVNPCIFAFCNERNLLQHETEQLLLLR